jgi:PAS domain S-box-containing protein
LPVILPREGKRGKEGLGCGLSQGGGKTKTAIARPVTKYHSPLKRVQECRGVQQAFACVRSPYLNDHRTAAYLPDRGIFSYNEDMERITSEILDNLDAVVYVADMKTYEILYVNKHARGIFGDIIGQICWRTLQANQTGPCDFCSNDKLLTRDGMPAGVYRWEFQNTLNKRWYDVRDKAIKWIDGRLVRLEIATDITELKTTQKELITAKEGWEKTFDAIPEIVMIIDREYRIIRANKALSGKLGIEREDLLGRLCYEVFHKSNKPHSFCPHNKASLDGRQHSAEVFSENMQCYYSLSAAPMFDVHGRFSGSIEIAYDITDRKRLEDRLRDLIETTSDWIWEVDKNGVYTYASQRVRDILGYEPEEVVGKTPFDLMPPEEAKRVAGIFKAFIDSQTPFSFVENINRHKDGKMVVLETSGVPFFDAKGTIRGYRGIDRDITERKKTEEEIMKLNQSLRQRASELENAYKDMESFSYAVSHDLKAPVRRIEGFSDMLLENYSEQLDEEGRNLLGIIGKNATKMKQLIDDLLAFSRVSIQEIRKSEIDMESLTRNVFEELKPHAGERAIRLEITTLPAANGDLSMIRSVLLNLLSNAIKFTMIRETPLIRVGSCPDQDENIYYVSDNGIGFDMKFFDKLFTLFQRIHTEKEFQGTGVGLVIVKRIIEKHGGRVWAEGKPNEGATFYFTLPHKKINASY